MNPNIAKQSLEALEIFRESDNHAHINFPWDFLKGGWLLDKDKDKDKLELITSVQRCIWTLDGHWTDKSIAYKYYLPTPLQLDQYIIDWNTEQDRIDVKHLEITHHLLHRYFDICTWNYRPDGDRNLSLKPIVRFPYTNAEEQYLAKCRVIAKAFELTREGSDATDK